MNAHNSLLDNFSNMQEEFNSSNNRMIRDIGDIFSNELKDLEESLDYFNGEYLVIDKRILVEKLKELKQKIAEVEVAHVSRFQGKFGKELEMLKQMMCNFFELKLEKGECMKKKVNCEIKKVVDRLCDFDVLVLEGELNNVIYEFKSNFERGYIRDEYCDDDFNRIIKSFEHEMFDKLRSRAAQAMLDKQEIIGRHISKGYEIIDLYNKPKR